MKITGPITYCSILCQTQHLSNNFSPVWIHVQDFLCSCHLVLETKKRCLLLLALFGLIACVSLCLPQILNTSRVVKRKSMLLVYFVIIVLFFFFFSDCCWNFGSSQTEIKASVCFCFSSAFDCLDTT